MIQKLWTFQYSSLFMCLQAEEEVARLKESHDQVGYKQLFNLFVLFLFFHYSFCTIPPL